LARNSVWLVGSLVGGEAEVVLTLRGG